MAKGQPNRKERLMEAVILMFVVVAVGLLVFQIATNVMETIEQERGIEQQTNTMPAIATSRPVLPTPTFDVHLTPDDA